MAKSEAQTATQSEMIEVMPVDSPSENAFVTEHLQRMPNIFSRGLIYLTVMILAVALIYSIFGEMDIVAECQAVARPLTHKVRILADRTGYLEEIFVAEGQEVEIDAPLFLVRARGTSEHELEVKRIKLTQNLSTIRSIDSELGYWRGEIERLQKEFEGIEKVYKLGIVSLREYNESKSKLDKARTEQKKLVSRKEVRIQENKIIEEEMEKYEEESEKLIKSESAGTISELYFKNTGEYIRESDLLCTIVPTDSPLYMDIVVANRDIGLIEEDMEIKYKFEAFPYKEYGILKGKVTTISPSAVEDKTQGFVYHVQGTLDKAYYEIREKNYAIKAGMTAVAELVTEKKSIFSLLFKKFRGA